MAGSTFLVERSISVDSPPARIFAHIADFHLWQQWSPWEGIDPDLKRTYSGPTSGPGARYAWSGNRKAGSGTMEITNATEPASVEIDLVFDKPFRARNATVFTIQPEGSQSRVTWSMTGAVPLLMRVTSAFFSMEKFLGPDFDKGLARLKAVTERADPDETTG